MKKSVTIMLIVLLAVFSILSLFLFYWNLQIFEQHSFSYGNMIITGTVSGVDDVLFSALTTISQAVSVFLSISLICVFAKQLTGWNFKEAVERFKQKQSAKKESNRKNKIEKLQNELTKLNNEEDE